MASIYIHFSDEEDSSHSKKVFLGPEARLQQLRTNVATYCNEADDMIDFLQYLETCDLEKEETKAEISDLMVECPEIRSLYSKLVPDAVTHNDFWQRYFYRFLNPNTIILFFYQKVIY